MVATTQPGALEAPFTLAEVPPRPLGLLDQVSLWGNLGISLLLPAAAPFVLLQGMSLVAALTAVVVGAVLGSAVLGLAAVPGARTGAPAMVLLRGLLGRQGSWLPTALNLLQCVGWATFEVVIIAASADRLTPGHLRWLFVLLAGGLATLMALRPLGAVRTLRRYAVWLVLAATAYLFVQVLREPLPPLTRGSWHDFWLAVDVVVALPVSWAPLAADYSRHSRSGRDAFVGAFAGYSVACTVYFALGVFAVAALTGAGDDLIGSLLALPVGGAALAILVLDELDEAFANIYSTAVSVQNLGPRLDRRVLAVAVGALSVLLALAFDVTSYESFLLLIGSVFVPLFAVVLVDWFLLRQGDWRLDDAAPARWVMALPWLLGFVAYQLVNPGSVSWWAAWWVGVRDAVGFSPASWTSASLVSFAVAAVATPLAGWVEHRPRRVAL